jgi:hypothetical protein
MLSAFTGGGGLSNSSTATATNGDFEGGGNGTSIGNMNFNGSKNTINPLMVGAFVLGGFLLWKMKK